MVTKEEPQHQFYLHYNMPEQNWVEKTGEMGPDLKSFLSQDHNKHVW